MKELQKIWIGYDAYQYYLNSAKGSPLVRQEPVNQGEYKANTVMNYQAPDPFEKIAQRGKLGILDDKPKEEEKQEEEEKPNLNHCVFDKMWRCRPPEGAELQDCKGWAPSSRDRLKCMHNRKPHLDHCDCIDVQVPRRR